MAAVVCSRALACSSVRPDKSRLPVAICVVAVAMASLPWRTLVTICTRLWSIACRVWSRSPVSSERSITIALPNCPCATDWATPTACTSGRVMERVITHARPIPKAAAIKPVAITIQRAQSAAATAWAPSSWAKRFCKSDKSWQYREISSNCTRVTVCSSWVAPPYRLHPAGHKTWSGTGRKCPGPAQFLPAALCLHPEKAALADV